MQIIKAAAGGGGVPRGVEVDQDNVGAAELAVEVGTNLRSAS